MYFKPLLMEECAKRLDLEKFIKMYILSEPKRLYEAEKLLLLLENEKGFKEKMLNVALGILRQINDRELKVTA